MSIVNFACCKLSQLEITISTPIMIQDKDNLDNKLNLKYQVYPMNKIH